MAATLLTKTQIGRETTAGIAVAADHVLRVPAAFLDDQREIEHVEEDVGYLSRINRTNTKKYLGFVSLPFQASFEDLPYLLDMGVKAVASGSTDTGGSGKIYTFAFPTTSANSIGSYTIEGSDGTQGYRIPYAFVSEFTLSGSGGNPVESSFSIYGRNVEKNTAASLVVSTAEVINFGKGKIYMDAVSGTAGTTQLTNTWLDFSLNVKTGWTANFTGDGSLYFSSLYNQGPEIMLDVTIEHDANAVTLFDGFQAETAKQIRMVFQGTALTTAGATYTHKTLQIDLVGKVEKWGPIQTRDGNNVVPITFRAAYDATAAKYATITVVNEVASL